mmetsp:Transcript_5997/g.25100  ORF Transcript_5997/g.25100 Transcript_5997/m.25100 type:complete len:215 (-) Transcript_5997:999-1643(-)
MAPAPRPHAVVTVPVTDGSHASTPSEARGVSGRSDIMITEEGWAAPETRGASGGIGVRAPRGRGGGPRAPRTRSQDVHYNERHHRGRPSASRVEEEEDEDAPAGPRPGRHRWSSSSMARKCSSVGSMVLRVISLGSSEKRTPPGPPVEPARSPKSTSKPRSRMPCDSKSGSSARCAGRFAGTASSAASRRRPRRRSASSSSEEEEEGVPRSISL